VLAAISIKILPVTPYTAKRQPVARALILHT
jgi:hypothetical protein